MANIELIEGPDTITFVLKGALEGPGVSELARVWEEKRASSYKKHFQLDLSHVSEVDHLGKEMLAIMHGRGTELLSTGPMMSAIIDEIVAREHDLIHH